MGLQHTWYKFEADKWNIKATVRDFRSGQFPEQGVIRKHVLLHYSRDNADGLLVLIFQLRIVFAHTDMT